SRGTGATTGYGTPDAHTVGYRWGEAGRRQTRISPLTGTAPGGTVTYDYDQVGRLASVSNPGTTLVGTTFSYLLDGRLDTIGRPNGVTTTDSYDPAGRLQSITHRTPSGELQRSLYGLDPNGNRTSQTSTDRDGARTETYTIDSLNQL